jgi:predicted nucleotidyltransferase
MMGGYSNPEFLSKLVQNLLSNKEQVDSIASGVEYSKLVRELQSRLTLERTPITQEALREKYDTVRQRHLPSDESQAVEDIEVTSEEIVAD